MNHKKILVAVSIVTLTLMLPFSCKTKAPALDCTTIESSYSKDIAPIISMNCMPCHSAGSKKGDWTTYAGVKTAVDNGNFENAVLIKKDMPPIGPLSLEDRKKIRCWLNDGAKDN